MSNKEDPISSYAKVDEPTEMSDGSQKVTSDEAFTIVNELRNSGTGTLGVLLTLAEVALGDSPALKSYKDSIRREMYQMIETNQDLVYFKLGVQARTFHRGPVYFSTDREVA